MHFSIIPLYLHRPLFSLIILAVSVYVCFYVSQKHCMLLASSSVSLAHTHIQKTHMYINIPSRIKSHRYTNISV